MKRIGQSLYFAAALVPACGSPPIAADGGFDTFRSPPRHDGCTIVLFPYARGAAPTHGEDGDRLLYPLFGEDLHRAAPGGCAGLARSLSRAPRAMASHLASFMSLTQRRGRVPGAFHLHRFIDRSSDDDGYARKSLLYEFQVILEKDAVANTNDVKCTTPVPSNFTSSLDLLHCNGFAPELYGGTKVSRELNSNGELVITWKFGVNAAGSHFYERGNANRGINAVPYTFGRSKILAEHLSKIDSRASLDDEASAYRGFEPQVTLTVRSTAHSGAFSVTTRSRALIRRYAVVKTALGEPTDANGARRAVHTTCGKLDTPDTGWCPEVPPRGRPEVILQLADRTERPRAFWMPVGERMSVWITD